MSGSLVLQIVREVAGRAVMPAIVVEVDERGEETKQTDAWSVTFYDKQGQQLLVLPVESRDKAFQVAGLLQDWLQTSVLEVLDRAQYVQK